VSDDSARAALLDLSVDEGPTTTVALSGDLDPATAPQLDEVLLRLSGEAEVKRVVLDLAELSFLDSSGLRVFVTAREALISRGADLVLRRPTANVSRLLDITGLGEIIEVDE
jgi:anti-sigma B factor antagonist